MSVINSRTPHLEHCLEDGDEHAGSALAQLLERVDGLRINANAIQERVDACLHKTKARIEDTRKRIPYIGAGVVSSMQRLKMHRLRVLSIRRININIYNNTLVRVLSRY